MQVPDGWRRVVVGAALAVVLLAGAVFASLLLGTKSADLGSTWRALVSPDGGELATVVHGLRVPRTVLGVVAGAALAVAGAQFQALTRNALADPGLLGVSAGAALAIVAGTALLGTLTPPVAAAAALTGALATSAIVFALATRGRRGGDPATLIITGIAVTTLLASMTTVIALSDRASLDSYRFWLVGALAGRELSLLWSALPLVVVGALVAGGTARRLDALVLGDDVARALGTRVARTRAAVTCSAAALTAGAVALAGPVTFVGLVAPHVARALVGPSHPRLLPACLLLGPVLVLAADVAGRIVIAPSEVQTGVVMALLGAPVLVAVVRRGALR